MSEGGRFGVGGFLRVRDGWGHRRSRRGRAIGLPLNCKPTGAVTRDGCNDYQERDIANALSLDGVGRDKIHCK